LVTVCDCQTADSKEAISVNITAFMLIKNGIKAAAFIAPEWLMSLSQSDALQSAADSKGDIILKTFIGMVFIMVMMWLAAIAAGKLGTKMTKLREKLEKVEQESTDETEINNDENKIGGDL